MKIKNLDKLIEKINELFPQYSCERGKETWLTADYTKHAPDYEVVRIFGKKGSAIEFWKGYYESYPEELTGIIVNSRFGNASVISSCETMIQDMLLNP